MFFLPTYVFSGHLFSIYQATVSHQAPLEVHIISARAEDWTFKWIVHLLCIDYLVVLFFFACAFLKWPAGLTVQNPVKLLPRQMHLNRKESANFRLFSFCYLGAAVQSKPAGQESLLVTSNVWNEKTVYIYVKVMHYSRAIWKNNFGLKWCLIMRS